MSESLAVLMQGSAEPIFRGTKPTGMTYRCGVCGTQVLAEATAEGDLYDVAFRCNSCSGLSMGPRLPAGRPLPWQQTVVLAPGEYMIRGTVEGRRGVVLAGREAVDRALHEAGADTAIHVGKPTELDADYLDSLTEQAKALLGDAHDELRASHKRGRRAKTPPRISHRLMELLDAAEEAARSFRCGTPAIDPVATVELHVTLGQLGRWKRHPVWPSLLPSLKSAQDFPHVVVTLAAASFLTDAGNAVELVQVAGERRPDLRLHLGARSAVGTEVKAPLALQRPQAPLDAAAAARVVRKALKSAGSGRGGQLTSNTDALLVIGAFGLRESDLDTLEAAAPRVLRRHAERRTHVLGVAVVSLGVLLDAREVGIGETIPTLNAILGTRLVPNANYSGPNTLSQEERPGLPRVDRPLEDFQLDLGATLPSSSVAGGPVIRGPHEKVGRNDPCWCGSGKKFKKCHGR
jgi:hypothetical protein